MIERTERELTAVERRTLERRVKRLAGSRTRTMWGSLATAAVFSAVLCAATLAASDAPRIVIVTFWTVAALALGLWVGSDNRRDFRRQIQALRAALEHNRARVFRVRSDRVVEFEEIEDEGACYAFQVSDDQVLFVMGQEFYADRRFPKSDFSLVEVIAAGDVPIDEMVHKDGVKLEPERRIPAETKQRLDMPEHLAVVRGDLRDLEVRLPRA